MTEFLCPHCLVARPFNTKSMSKEMTLYPIPILEAKQVSRVIECQVCKNIFDSDILKQYIQFQLKLAGAAKQQFDRGVSPGYLKLQLISDGLKESFVDRLITLAQH